ncbi:MAG TPA: hypothetical protein VLV83_14630 [Acidobacteriota bacterium]|nr:hypothetical protein [Acidobacteriota bacterium]
MAMQMRDLQSELLRSPQALKCGSVWRLPETVGKDDSVYKYCIHLGTFQNYCLYLLSTSRGHKIPSAMRGECLPIRAGSYPFWPRDTWIDCREIRHRPQHSFRAQIANDPRSRYCGLLALRHLSALRRIVSESRYLPPLEKRIVLDCLNA